MTEILHRWLDEELRIPVAEDTDTFLQQFGNGQLLGKILNVEGVLPDKKFDQLRTNNLYEDRLHNFLVIGPFLKTLGVNLSVRQAREILSDKPGSLTFLVYQVYLALHKPREHLRLDSPEPLSDAYKERLRESARPDLRDSGLASLALTCQCYGREVEKTRIAEAHLVKECQQKIIREGEKKKARAKEIKEEMIEEYMQGDSAKLWGRLFRGASKPHWQRERDRKEAEAVAVAELIDSFEATADLRKVKYEDVRNAEFLQTTVTPDMIPEALVNPEANQQFVQKLRDQLEKDKRARFEREKRRKQMYLRLRDARQQQEEERREMDLVHRLLRQGDYELRLAAHLNDIKRQKQVIVRNRLEKDKRMKERRQDEFERSIQQQIDLLSQKRMEHQEELLKEAQLHGRLLQQRREQKAQRHQQLAMHVVLFCMDMAVLTVDYRTKSGDREVPLSMVNDWRELFIRGESLSAGGDPEELSATTTPSEHQLALLSERDLLEYITVQGPWAIPPEQGKKKSAQVRDDAALQVDQAVVTGHVVHRLLQMVYPPKPSVPAPARPSFTLMGAVLGKSYAGKTECLQRVQQSLGVHHVEMHALVRRALASLEAETELELKAAGSSVMEALRITDLLPDGQESREQTPRQREPAAEQPDGETEGDTRDLEEKVKEMTGENKIDATEVTLGSPTKGSPRSAEQSRPSTGKVSFVMEQDAAQSQNTEITAEDESLATPKAPSPGSPETQSSRIQPLIDLGEKTPAVHRENAEPPSSEGDLRLEDGQAAEGDPAEGGQPSPSASQTAEVEFEYSRLAQLGREVHQALGEGQPVRDQTLVDLLLEAWRELADGDAWMVEGFPNTPEQAALLEEQLLGRHYDSDEELDPVEIEVTPLPQPEPPQTDAKKNKKDKKEPKDKKAKDGKKGKEKSASPTPEEPPPPPPPPEPVRMTVKPFRRSRLVPDDTRREKPPPTSGLDLVFELVVSDEAAQRRRCELIDDIDALPDSGTAPGEPDDHVTLAGKLFSYTVMRQPLVDFYRERGVYRRVEAEGDMAEVESQLLELVEACKQRKEAEQQVRDEEAARLYAAENASDSEPESEPEPEPEPEKNKRAKSGKKSGKKERETPEKDERAEKAGKGKGKKGKDAESGAAKEDNPLIPVPPPMPMPGETGYFYVDSPVPEDVAKYLALMWQQTEQNYTESLKRWLGSLRLEHKAVIEHLHATLVSFDAFLLRPDHKQQFLDRFVSEFNKMDESLMCDEEAKCEWYLRIQELENTIWNITDKRRCEAEQERYNVMTSGWIEDRLALAANDWLMVLQAEMDRFQDTCAVLEDYYASMSGGQLPDNIGRPQFKQGVIEIPAREVASSNGSSAGSEGRHAGNNRNSSAAAKQLKKPSGGGGGGGGSGRPQEKPDSTVPVITLPQLRPRIVFARGKNQSDDVTTAVEGVVDSACKSMLAFVAESRDRGEGRVRTAFLPPEEAGGKKGAKKAASKPAKKAAKASGVEEDPVEAEREARRERGERAMAEYQVAAREEASRVTARLALVRQRAVAELHALRQRAVAAFQRMWTVIGAQYEREVAAAGSMADYLRSAVERQQRIFYELLLDQDKFIVRTGVFTHLPCLPASPLPPSEALARDCFSLDQAAMLWRQLSWAAPSGTLSTRAFSFILQDLVVCGVGTQELPEVWMSLTQTEIESFSARLADGAEVLSWRGLVYDLLEPWQRPDQFDIQEALAIAHVLDKERTGRVTLDQALQVVHWMKLPRGGTEDACQHASHLKRLLILVTGAPGDDTVDYETLLMWLSRSGDVLQSLLLALSILEDAPVFITSPEDDEKYFPRDQVDLSAIESLPHQKVSSPPPTDERPRQIRLAKSAPQFETKEESPSEVLLKTTKADVYQQRSSVLYASPGSSLSSVAARGEENPSLASLPGSREIRASSSDGGSRRQLGSSAAQSQPSLESAIYRDTATTDAETNDHETRSESTAPSQILNELRISHPGGHTLDSWTELAPSCCTHPAEAPQLKPSDLSAGRQTGNRTTLNAIRTVLARTLVMSEEMLEPALQRLDLDLSVVYRDLYGGSCCRAVEALRSGELLPVPILDVFQHDITQRYLGSRCTLVSGRPWQVIRDLRSPPETAPCPAEPDQPVLPTPSTATAGTTV